MAIFWVTWFIFHIISGRHNLSIQDGAKRQGPRHIEGEMIHKLPVHGLHADGTDVEYRCVEGEVLNQPKRYKLWGGLNGTRQPLKYPLNQSGLFDFAVHISEMKLRVLIVGNSLGEQLHAGLEEAVCYPVNMNATMSTSDRMNWGKQRSTCNTEFADNPDGQWIREPRIVSTQADGMLAVIKDNTHMIDTKTKWVRNNTAISSLLQALNDNNHNSDKGNADDSNMKQRRNFVDVLVYQFQSGHVDLNDFDEYYLTEAILAAGDLFQATTVIFPTIAWMNNVDSTRVDKWYEVNDRIRNFGRMYTRSEKSTVTSVMVLDMAELSRLYIEANARILNIPPDETYSLRVESMWESLVAQYCASLPFAEDPRGCLPGMVSVRVFMYILL